MYLTFIFWGVITTAFAQVEDRRPLPVGEDLTSCKSAHPLNTSKDICGDICHPGAQCVEETGACMCDKEPGASNLGGHAMHCTNWNYVEQKSCKDICTKAGKNDCRVCWTGTIGNYCACFSR